MALQRKIHIPGYGLVVNSYQAILYNPKGSWSTLYLMHRDTKRPLPHINIINLYIIYMLYSNLLQNVTGSIWTQHKSVSLTV